MDIWKSSHSIAIIGHFNMFQVSWMRKRDLHILTIGTTVYTHDDRFGAVHPNATDDPTERARFGDTSPDWNLVIKVWPLTKYSISDVTFIHF